MRDRRTSPTRPTFAIVLTIVLGVSLAAACGGGGEIAISTATLTGQVGGVSWTLGTAESNAFLSSNSDQFFVDAYAETLAPCTGAGTGLNTSRLILNIPKTPGDYQLSAAITETFYVPATNSNFISGQGRIVVDEVTATTVRGGAHFFFDNANFVDGQFQAQICPP